MCLVPQGRDWFVNQPSLARMSGTGSRGPGSPHATASYLVLVCIEPGSSETLFGCMLNAHPIYFCSHCMHTHGLTHAPREPGRGDTLEFPASSEPGWERLFAPRGLGSEASSANQSYQCCIYGPGWAVRWEPITPQVACIAPRWGG
jgi:hypothetical protein